MEIEIPCVQAVSALIQYYNENKFRYEVAVSFDENTITICYSAHICAHNSMLLKNTGHYD